MKSTTELKCPVNRKYYSKKRTDFESIETELAYKLDEAGVWHIYNYSIAEEIMHSKDVFQSGFGAKLVRNTPKFLKIKEPLLYLEGEAHKKFRRNTAKFFTPKTTDTVYKHLIEELSTNLLNDFKQKGSCELNDLTLRLTMTITAKILGLTNSPPLEMAHRLNKIVRYSGEVEEFSFRPSRLVTFAKLYSSVFHFYLKDVLPAIKTRRKQLENDVISYLIEQGNTQGDIQSECMSSAAAGMISTREFISLCALHLFKDKELLEVYLSAEQKERCQLLEEILRLEPPVSILQRTTNDNITFEWASKQVTIPTGSEIFIHISSINFNKDIVGTNEKQICPARGFPKKIPSYMFSFGDGNHKCPGAYLAIQETDIFLKQLFSIKNIQLVSEPTIVYMPALKGYAIRDFKISQ